MSIFTLLITFLGSLFKSQRQLILENLALRQQVTMLRQSVNRPRAAAADRMFRSKRDVNKRKHQTSRRTRQPDAKHLSQTLPPHRWRRVVRVAEYNWSFLLPPYSPYSFPFPQTYRPASSKGVSYSARSGQLPPAAPATSYWHQSGNLWSTMPRSITLPMPWPICSPKGLASREERVLAGEYP